jgi:hypothetical protein
MFLESKVRWVRRADNLTTIYKQILSLLTLMTLLYRIF